MAHTHTADDELFADREVRDSIMIIRRQRTTKLLVAVVGMIIALGALFGAVYVSYQGEVKTDAPAQPQ